MARIIKNDLLKGVSGKIGKGLVVRSRKDGTQVLASKPARRKKHSEGQKKHLSLTSLSRQYAKNVGKRPEIRKVYDRMSHGSLNWYNLASGDYMQQPEVHEIRVDHYAGEPGEIIRIRAIDDFKVTSVSVRITGADKKLIEKGEAEPRGKKGLWRYFVTKKNLKPQGTIIEAFAMDLPGNTGIGILTCSNTVGEQKWQLPKGESKLLAREKKKKDHRAKLARRF